MDEQRKYAILFAATILAARKLADPDLNPWPRTAIIRDAISSANQILEEIDAGWPVRRIIRPYRDCPHSTASPLVGRAFVDSRRVPSARLCDCLWGEPVNCMDGQTQSQSGVPQSNSVGTAWPRGTTKGVTGRNASDAISNSVPQPGQHFLRRDAKSHLQTGQM